MAALNGYVLGPQTWDNENPWITTDLNSFTYFLFTPHSDPQITIARGLTTMHLPGPRQQEVKSGFYNQTYFEDLWLRIHINPPVIDVGSLLSQQTRDLDIWNAFLVPVEISSIELTGFDGISLLPPSAHSATPYDLQPNEEITYKVVIGLDGPPVINAEIIFHTSEGDLHVLVKGSRVVLFPFVPNWASPITETLSARSSTVRSYGGVDQTISVRNKVRRSFNIPYTLYGVQAQRMTNLLAGWQMRFFGIPVWPEASYSTATTLELDVVIQVPTVYRSFAVGGLVMVYEGKDSSVYEVREIESFNDSSITVTVPFTRQWRKGSKVIPVLLSQVDTSVSGQWMTGNSLSAQMTFQCEPSTSNDNTDATQTVTLYRGYEIYLGRTNWRDTNSMNFNTDATRVDMEGGVFELKMLSNFSPEGRSHDWFLKNLQAVRQFRNWISRRKGKTVGCWMPSSHDDFTLATEYVANSTAITVVDNGYAIYIAQNPARRDIFILLRNGTHYERRITGSTQNPDGTLSLLLDTSIPVTFNDTNLRQFSYLSFYRMASDDTVLTWHVEGVAEAVTGLLPTKAIT